MPIKRPKLQIKKLSQNATIPTRAEGTPAGLDLYALVPLRIAGKGLKLINTGLAMAIEEGYFIQIEERSGVSVKTSLSKKAGIIDSDYRGEVKIVMQNISDVFVDIEAGEKIAQFIVHRHYDPVVEVVETFDQEETERGDNGFGASGS
jgi:dUTP pyrophosphatase